MGTKSTSRERSTTRAAETTTPTYQQYATPVVESMYPSMQAAYKTSMAGYGEPGYNPSQQALWSQVGQQALNKYGTQGPYMDYLGTGYMQTLDPYFAAQRKYIEGAMPQQEKQFMQELKKQFGPAWGTHGQALAGATDAYGTFKSQQAQQLANLEAQQAAAAQQGMQYSAQVNPFAWGQQAVGWAGAPDVATQEAMQAQQALATGWSNPLTQLATMGYTFPAATTTVGDQASRGYTTGGSGGLSCCFIMNEAGDFTNAVRRARNIRYQNDREVADGYRKMAKWLVPLMQKSSIVKFLVKWTMTHPIAKVAEVRKVDKHQPALYPIGLFWEAIWRIYGMPAEDRKSFNYVVKRLARFSRI